MCFISQGCYLLELDCLKTYLRNDSCMSSVGTVKRMCPCTHWENYLCRIWHGCIIYQLLLSGGYRTNTKQPTRCGCTAMASDTRAMSLYWVQMRSHWYICWAKRLTEHTVKRTVKCVRLNTARVRRRTSQERFGCRDWTGDVDGEVCRVP